MHEKFFFPSYMGKEVLSMFAYDSILSQRIQTDIRFGLIF